MKTVYVILAENPDKTRRFVDVKGSKIEAEKLIEEFREDATKININVDYHILEKNLS